MEVRFISDPIAALGFQVLYLFYRRDAPLALSYRDKEWA